MEHAETMKRLADFLADAVARRIKEDLPEPYLLKELVENEEFSADDFIAALREDGAHIVGTITFHRLKARETPDAQWTAPTDRPGICGGKPEGLEIEVTVEPGMLKAKNSEEG